jgi:hypothetical protein
MSLFEALAEAGFELVQERRNGDRQYGLRSNSFLAWWVLTHPDGTVELSWEFELGAYLKEKGFHISVQDELSLLLFPRAEIRGPADADWLASQLEQAKAQLASVDLLGAG